MSGYGTYWAMGFRDTKYREAMEFSPVGHSRSNETRKLPEYLARKSLTVTELMLNTLVGIFSGRGLKRLCGGCLTIIDHNTSMSTTGYGCSSPGFPMESIGTKGVSRIRVLAIAEDSNRTAMASRGPGWLQTRLVRQPSTGIKLQALVVSAVIQSLHARLRRLPEGSVKS
ncbi:hypothetical protein BJY00DRAFT_210029 [Aspergillus carlsbadensis]|nr:hypothetical protein BJY00DRAFT_210029 [Aspergillus carlsbadensis]